ncbi:MAG: energy-coupling factor transport system substrate-specific component [Thermoleophilaceae bacterium]|jgi:energy-coupling factor transport system substrate-specific component|nr:energy-coupling factor transport system substrate-specific component [Thermoleophilaceae bacterium]
MTWQLASVLVLTAALAIGFAWYERSRPPARVLALVAALAALGAIGRVAFAAFPNVKPTSDIVLFSGYALGGAPGFAVGAVAALVSNVFLGQGPWTPWQMASWGVVGIGGGLLGRVMRRREPNRLLLAVVCGLAGFLFGALMDLYQWTLAAEHTFSSYVAVSGTSLAFNIAHAVGNVAFALILGPAFIRALERYRRRFEVRWITAPARAAAATMLLVLVLAAPAYAADPPPDVAPAIGRAIHYLRFSQNSDGGFGAARGQSSTTLHSGWTALGLAAAGRNPQDVRQRGNSIVTFVNAHATGLGDIGELERTLLVLRAAGLPPRIGSSNLLANLIGKQKSGGSFGTVNHTAFGILALRAHGRSTRSREVRRAVAYLIGAQNKDGGFGFAKTSGSDVDDTGSALQAIAAAGRERSPAVGRAVAYLRKAQRSDGGFGQMTTSDSNAQSTSFAIQGLVAAGRNPRRWKRTRTPIEFLKSLQAADGSVRYSRTSAQTPVWVTAQALDALEAKPFPLPPAPRQKARSVKAAAKPVAKAAAPAPKHTQRTRRKHRRAHPRPAVQQLQVRPAAQTTTQTTAAPGTSDANGGKGSYWPFIFAVVLGGVMLAGIRLAWRRA